MVLCVNAQKSDLLNLIDKGEYVKAKALFGQVFSEDTTSADYFFTMYSYYIKSDNEDKDYLLAYEYLIKYNQVSKTKIDKSSIAREVLTDVYQSKDIDRFNKYIALTEDMPELNKEAKRICYQLAYDHIQETQSIEDYKHFIQAYPDAPQREDAMMWLNENLLQEYVQSNNIDSLKSFAKTTSSDIYRSKALSEIDRLSFSKALKENTVDSYMAYIKEFPQGDYIRVAKTNIERVQYEMLRTQNNITDMIAYLTTTPKTDKNYKEFFDKLSYCAMERYSLLAMKTVQDIEPNESLLNVFARRYAYDLDLHRINMLLETFPKLKDNADVIQAKKDAQTLETLKNKKDLTLEDYKANKSLFKKLDAQTVGKIFETFEELNSKQPKSKILNFGLQKDYTYLQFKNAQSMEMNMFLTETPTQLPKSCDDVRFVSKVDSNGYDYYDGSTNRDIFYSVLENGTWSNPTLLPSPINSRYDDCNAVMSADKKTLYFSSDRGMNFGKKDIYVSYREDINDWNNWSEPVLLGEEFNTKDDDYVVALTDSLIVLTQDDTFNPQNYICLEGKTNFSWLSGKINTKNLTSPQLTKINIYDKQTLELKNIIHPNENGFYAVLKTKDYVLACQRRNFYCPLSETVPELHYIEQMVSKHELVTIKSPFDESGSLTKTGKKDLEILAESFVNTPYILTIGVHSFKLSQKTDGKDLSDKHAKQIYDILVKQGMDKDNIVITGYGKEGIVQGWEGKSSLDIGAMMK